MSSAYSIILWNEKANRPQSSSPNNYFLFALFAGLFLSFLIQWIECLFFESGSKSLWMHMFLSHECTIIPPKWFTKKKKLFYFLKSASFLVTCLDVECTLLLVIFYWLYYCDKLPIVITINKLILKNKIS